MTRMSDDDGIVQGYETSRDVLAGTGTRRMMVKYPEEEEPL